jgi:hypothetical protein
LINELNKLIRVLRRLGLLPGLRLVFDRGNGRRLDTKTVKGPNDRLSLRYVLGMLALKAKRDVIDIEVRRLGGDQLLLLESEPCFVPDELGATGSSFSSAAYGTSESLPPRQSFLR